MTKLESYQRGGSFAATEFYADIVGKPGDPSIDNALDELGFQTKWVRLLGTYPQARARPEGLFAKSRKSDFGGGTGALPHPATHRILALGGRDRKSVGEGKGVSVRVDPGGRRRIKKKK